MVKHNSYLRVLSLVSQLGISMAVPILLCVLLGAYLDNKTGREPLFTIIFILLGVGAAFRNLFYIVGKEAKKGEKDE